MAKKNNEAKIKFTAETGEFNKAIAKASEDISQLTAELALNEEQMKTGGKSIEKLQKKQKLLAKEYDAAKDKTQALNDKLNKAVEIFGENSSEATKLKRQLTQAATQEEKLKTKINACNTELEKQEAAEKQAKSATAQLTDTIEEQQSELDDLKRRYVDATLEYGENSKEAKGLEKDIKKLSKQLKTSKDKMSDASDKADELDKSLDNAGESASGAQGGFTILKGALSNLISAGIQTAIGKLGELVGWLAELPEETRDSRKNMVTMETAFENAGFSAEQAANTTKGLYEILGDEDRAVEAANSIAAMSDNQKDLSKWVQISTGVWGEHQDKLPIESLAEAAMETSKVGTVTGALADALNWGAKEGETFGTKMKEQVKFTKKNEWQLSRMTKKQREQYYATEKQYNEIEAYNTALAEAKTAEDFFNVALMDCSTEQERQQLIMQYLGDIYGDSADSVDESTKSIQDANAAAWDAQQANNELGEAVEPVTTAWTNMKTQLITAVTPAISSVCDGLMKALGWLQEHPTVLNAVATGLAVFATALGVVAIAWGVYTAAQWLANAAMLVPILTVVAVVAAFAALVAAITWVVQNWEWVKTKAVEIWGAIKQWFSDTWVAIKEAATNAWEGIKTWFSETWTSIKDTASVAWEGIKTWFSETWESIKTTASAAWDGIKTWFSETWTAIKDTASTAWEGIKTFFSDTWTSIKDKASTVWEAVKTFFSDTWTSIKTTASDAWEGLKTTIATAVDNAKNKVTTVWTNIKTTTSNLFNGVKNTVSNIWDGIKDKVTGVVDGIKTKITSIWTNIKTTTSNLFGGIKTTVTNIWESIKSTISTKIEDAKTKVSNVINAIKGFFNFSFTWPTLKMPHFSIKPEGWKIGDLLEGSIPSLGISWYAEGGIMRSPTIFGRNGNNLMAGGEAGPEAILPISKLDEYITNAVENKMSVVNLQALADAIEDLASRPFVVGINGRELVRATASDSDSVNGLRSTFKNRGLVMD